MFKRFKYCLLFVVLFLIYIVPLLAESKNKNIGDWIFAYEKEDVIVHKKPTTNQMTAFRGEKVIFYPISELVGVLTDNQNRIHWVNRLVEVVELEVNSQMTKSTVYQLFQLPFPFNPRYYVIEGKLIFNKSKNQVALNLRSVKHPQAPIPNNGVEAILFESRYLLTMLSSQKTHVVVEIHTDPKGNMPAWIANLVQNSWPRKTLLSLEEQVAKNTSKEHPYTKKQFGL